MTSKSCNEANPEAAYITQTSYQTLNRNPAPSPFCANRAVSCTGRYRLSGTYVMHCCGQARKNQKA